MQAVDLGQQILLASERVESGLKYSSELIQNHFLQTVITGLHDDTIRADLKPYLQGPKVKDEVLLEKMTATYSLEMERKNKLQTTSKAKMIKVAAVSKVNEKTEEESCTNKPNDKNKKSETCEHDTQSDSSTPNNESG